MALKMQFSSFDTLLDVPGDMAGLTKCIKSLKATGNISSVYWGNARVVVVKEWLCSTIPFAARSVQRSSRFRRHVVQRHRNLQRSIELFCSRNPSQIVYYRRRIPWPPPPLQKRSTLYLLPPRNINLKYLYGTSVSLS
jgi:hypothetical protein